MNKGRILFVLPELFDENYSFYSHGTAPFQGNIMD